MSDKKFPWFRTYSEIVSDRKVAMMARTTGRSKAEIIGFLTILFALGSESPVRGKLLISLNVPYTEHDISDVAGIDVDGTKTIMLLSQRLEILDNENGVWIIRNWDKRQYKSDDSSERVTKFREKHSSNGNETLHERYSNGDVTPPETESESDTESDTDKQASIDFDGMRKLCEQKTGYLIPNTENDTKALDEFVKWGVIPTDFDEALLFFSQRGLTARGPFKLRNSIQTAVAKRTQKTNGQKANKEFIPEEHASEVYGGS